MRILPGATGSNFEPEVRRRRRAHLLPVLTVALTSSVAFWLALALVQAAPALAVPAAPIDIHLTQPDGSTFVARQFGDEWANGFETARGYTIVEDPASHYWVYATSGPAGHLQAGDLRVGLDAPKGISRHLRDRSSRAPGSGSLSYSGLVRSTVNTGTQRSLVILAQFSDQAGTTTAANWSSRFFGATNSVSDYYDEVSYQQLTIAPASENHGTANDGIVGWLTMGYAHPNTAGTIGATNRTLTRDAVLAADPYVNFASYDSNSDGYLSASELHVTIVAAGIEAGYSTGCGNSVWAHRWALFGAEPPTVDGVVFGDAAYGGGYTQVGEMDCAYMATLGTPVHEFGHDLNLPDLYDIDKSSEGVGEWSIMGSGSWLAMPAANPGTMPAHPDPFSRAYEGWLTPQQLAGTNSGTSVPQSETSPTAYRLLDNPGGIDWTFNQTSGSGEYFLIENRQKTGYDAALKGCGLLIWHVDETRTSTNSANADESRKLVDLEEADGLGHLDSKTNRSDAGDPYPGSGANMKFDATSNPNSNLYGGASSGVSVVPVSTTCSSSMTANFVAPLPRLSIDDVPASEGDSGTKGFGFTASLSSASASTVTVNYATADGTATQPSDYSSASGALTFTPGQTTRPLSVTVNGDTTVESDESFYVNLSAPTNATIADGQGQGTILNDDAPVPTSLSIGAPSKVAAGSRAKVTGVLSSANPACVSSQQVTLMKGAATAGTATTGATGAYKFVLKIKKKTTVRVTYAGTAQCAASTSVKKTIGVT